MTVRRESVVLCRTGPGQLRADLERVLALAGAERLDPARRTLIKFNGNVKRYYPGSNTSRWFLDALLGSLHDPGCRDVSLIEGDLPQFTVEEMLRHTALDRVLARHGVRCINYEHLPRKHQLPLLLEDAQVLNTPTMHTHGFAVVSCATKNLFGLLPVDRWRHHPALSATLLDLAARVATFTVVDGTVSMYGDSPRTVRGRGRAPGPHVARGAVGRRRPAAPHRRAPPQAALPPPRCAVSARLVSRRQSRRPRPRVPPHRRPQRRQRHHAHLRERGQGVVARPVVVGEVRGAEAEEARLEAEARRVGEEVEEVAGEEPAAELPDLVAPHLRAVAGDRHLVEERGEV